jgi:hypothetical protein
MLLLILGFLTTTVPTRAAPQAPIAAGKIHNVSKFLRAARACHVEQFRIEIFGEGQYEFRLYLLQDPKDAPIKCFESWLAKNA